MTETDKLASLARMYETSTDYTFKKLVKEAAERVFSSLFTGVGDLLADEIKAGVDQGKIYCIRLHKVRTGMRLKDSKDTCEAFFAKNKLQFYSGPF